MPGQKGGATPPESAPRRPRRRAGQPFGPRWPGVGAGHSLVVGTVRVRQRDAVRAARSSPDPRDRRVTRENVPLADVLAGQVTYSRPGGVPASASGRRCARHGRRPTGDLPSARGHWRSRLRSPTRPTRAMSETSPPGRGPAVAATAPVGPSGDQPWFEILVQYIESCVISAGFRGVSAGFPEGAVGPASSAGDHHSLIRSRQSGS